VYTATPFSQLLLPANCCYFGEFIFLVALHQIQAASTKYERPAMSKVQSGHPVETKR